MMKHISYADVVKDLEAHPNKRLFWRAGYRFKGAGEREILRNADAPCYPRRACNGMVIASWKDDLKKCYDWACLVECDGNSDEEMHLNGLSENDLY